jgi:hypothetical protein
MLPSGTGADEAGQVRLLQSVLDSGWTWLPERSSPVVQLFAHAFFDGCPLGWYLGRSSLAAKEPGHA